MQVPLSPIDPRGHYPWPTAAGTNDTSTPARGYSNMGNMPLSPPPYYPPNPWSPIYHPWAPPAAYPYYPSSPAPPTSYQGSTPERSPGAALSQVAAVSGPIPQRGLRERSANHLIDTPSGSQVSMSSRCNNGVDLLLDGTVNLASPRWDLSPVVIEAVSVAGGVNNDSLQSYLDRSVVNFQELVRTNPDPAMLEEALAGASMELQVTIFNGEGEMISGIKGVKLTYLLKPYP
jgi:hypothetical protein